MRRGGHTAISRNGSNAMTKKSTRRAQSVVPFGVGAMVEFEGETLMAAGLDEWPVDAQRIRDDRLAALLAKDHFRVPPGEMEEGWGNTSSPMPYVRFPQWHFCPRCRVLRRLGLFDRTVPSCGNLTSSAKRESTRPCGALPAFRRPKLVPLQFVAVCEHGHLEDFPWNSWAHSEVSGLIDREITCDAAELYLQPTRWSGLAGLHLSCSACGKGRSMIGSVAKSGLRGFECQGAMPWLGRTANDADAERSGHKCARAMQGMHRGASNIYFPTAISSILLPTYSTKLMRLLESKEVRESLEEARGDDGTIPASAFRMIARLKGVDATQLEDAYQATTREVESCPTEFDGYQTEFRWPEYRSLQETRIGADELLTSRTANIEEYGTRVRDHFAKVVFVERLTETRALTGFSRIYPSTGGPALSRRRTDWLPAFRVHGEGIFVLLDADRVVALGEKSGSRALKVLARAGHNIRLPLPPTASLILIHTLAHLLIKRISYEAGYGASSIRERIYATDRDTEWQMHGLLLYTAAGDADGTLGGLVHLARPGSLDRVLESALEDARWCASDPVCMESKGQGRDSLNLAACHACSLLPETSCELQNRLLDRRLLLDYFGM